MADYPPPKHAAVIDTETDRISDHVCVGRYTADFAYEGEFQPPPYGEDGAYILSLVPFGQLGFYVFLKEDPEYIYAFPFGAGIMLGDLSAPAAVSAARKRFSISQREVGVQLDPE
jgi:hypothetical protein